MGRTLAIVGIFLVGDALGTNAYAQNANAPAQSIQWCAYFTGGPTNCGFATFEDCLKTIKGKTGLCTQNPQNQEPPADDQSAPVHHHRRRLHRLHQRQKKAEAAQTEAEPDDAPGRAANELQGLPREGR